MVHALQIDTLEFANNLKAAGADDGLANAIVKGITSADTSELATKSDLADLKTELKDEIHKSSRSNLFAIGAIMGVFLFLDKIFPILGLG